MSGGQEPLAPGTRLWSVATGSVNPLMRRSRQAARFVAGLDGFMAVAVLLLHGQPGLARVLLDDGLYRGSERPAEGGMLWLFGSEGAAVRARNLMEGRGIACGRNICGFTIADDGALEMDGLEGE